MKIVIPGGAGHLGRVLGPLFASEGHDVVVLSRSAGAGATGGSAPGPRTVGWDGRTPGPWTREIDGADAVVNLAGRSVNCRYTPANIREMMDSRVASTRAIGAAIAQAVRPPRVWLQMSTATLYAHRYDAANDERDGRIGGSEPDAPAYWKYSIDIARAWEAAQQETPTPATRKVALRTAMVMSVERGGVLEVLLRLVRLGIGGPIAGGRQFVSWIHERDFARAVAFLIERADIEGPVNVTAPAPLPQREFMAHLRRAAGMPVGLPATRWMVEAGAVLLRTDTELILKSRRVTPGRLLEHGFRFDYPDWPAAARDLVARSRPRAS